MSVKQSTAVRAFRPHLRAFSWIQDISPKYWAEPPFILQSASKPHWQWARGAAWHTWSSGSLQHFVSGVSGYSPGRSLRFSDASCYPHARYNQFSSIYISGKGKDKKRAQDPKGNLSFTQPDTPAIDLCQVGVPKSSQLISQEEAHRTPTLQLVSFHGVPVSLPPTWKLIFTGNMLNLIVTAQLSLPLLYKSRK